MLLKRVTLHRFCGFTDFQAELGQLTVLVGPNNGGKTTLLRAIKFVSDTVQLYFGNGGDPNFAKRKEGWQVNLEPVGARLGVQDPNYFYFQKIREAHSSLSLVFASSEGEITVNLICLRDSNTIQLAILLDKTHLKDLEDEEQAFKVIRGLYTLNTLFVPPIGTISPQEQELPWPELQRSLAQGKYAETWRNQLHWLSEGKEPEAFQRVVSLITQYIPNVIVKPPLRSKGSPPQVEIFYRENDTEYDISASGGGLRALLALATAIELSGAPLLLFDEPDSHLHSSVQRLVANLLADQASGQRQIIVATHAPDMLEEMPVESLVWIDKGATEGKQIDETGKVLVTLGALSHSQAIQFLGADTILYFEDKPDRRVFSLLMQRCGKNQLLQRARLECLKGYGDIKNLPGALRVLRALKAVRIAVAAIRDADYTQLLPHVTIENDGDILVIRLPCKELENLVLLSAKTIADAVKKAAGNRENHVDHSVASPSEEEIEEKIKEFSAADDVKAAIEFSWKTNWIETTNVGKGVLDPGQLKQAETEFQKHWKEFEWRRRCCSGKLILKHIRQWLQSEPYTLSFGLDLIFKAYEPDDEIKQIFEAVEKHVISVLGK